MHILDEDIEVGDYYIDCGWKPRECVEINYEEDDLCGINLVDNTRGYCSPYNCNPKKINQVEALKLTSLWLTEGKRGVMIYMGYDPKEVDTFIKEWG